MQRYHPFSIWTSVASENDQNSEKGGGEGGTEGGQNGMEGLIFVSTNDIRPNLT